MAKKPLHREKFIYPRHNAATGADSYRVLFFYKSGGKRMAYSKDFKVSDFYSAGDALMAAVQHRDEMLVKKYAQSIPAAKGVTIDELMDLKKQTFSRSYNTNLKHEKNYNHYLKKTYGCRNIRDITPDDISNSLQGMVDHCSQDTIKMVLSLWHLLIRTALRKRMITVDPSAGVEAPKSLHVVRHREVITDRDTIEAVLDALERHAKHSVRSQYNYRLYRFALQVMYYTGLRPSECYALSRSSVDLDSCTLHIFERVGSDSSHLRVIVPLKNNFSERYIPLSAAARKVFEEMLLVIKENYLFTDYDGKLISSDIVANVITRVCKAEDLDFRMYMLRHTFDNDLMLHGVDNRTIMELMGHTELKTTVGYARSNDEIKREVVNKRNRKTLKRKSATNSATKRKYEA